MGNDFMTWFVPWNDLQTQTMKPDQFLEFFNTQEQRPFSLTQHDATIPG